MTTELIFNLANLFVLPFWGLMIFFPRWQWTQRLMGSVIPFVVLALVYLYFFVFALSPESAEALASPNLADIARAFSNEKVMAAGWTHYLVMDLFAGRWIYEQGQKTGVWTIHSLLLCLFAGPLGLLSHFLTAAIVSRFFPAVVTSPEEQPAP
ncbi:ABA4-like family protein [Synechocystis sp. LKSZ1]|uniref:ABA4-like family protein n=1 Tax=Synechocystis sp. LKSZ1 TaxID=3144951 RepID=UPI00336BEE0E